MVTHPVNWGGEIFLEDLSSKKFGCQDQRKRHSWLGKSEFQGFEAGQAKCLEKSEQRMLQEETRVGGGGGGWTKH